MFDQSSFAKKHFKKLVVNLDLGSPRPINSKMNYVANQLNFKNISFQKFVSTLVLKVEDFLENTFKWGHTSINKILGHTRIKQHSPT